MSPQPPPRTVVLVTGAARRIGRDIALQLARSGRDVAVHYRRSQADALQTVAECRSLGAQAHAFEADLSDEAACRALVPAVLDRFGRLDAVVNNASTFEYDNAASFSHACMERHWRANTAPAVILAQALHEHLSGRDGSGCVVNLVDQKLWNPNPDHFSYTLSKAALEAANTMLALALAPTLRVCGVAPGVTLVSGPMTEAQLAQAQQLTPLRHSSSPADIAHAVCFLLDSPAITGTTLIVDGGQHLSAQRRDVLYLTPKS
jgi:NAD(P)-dependent dehydrogenase (short-subunit alcohol dehydrogenase family)